MHIPLINEHLFSIYSCPSVCRSGYKRQKCIYIETSITADILDRSLIFLLNIPLINDNLLFFEYFVRWSVGQALEDKKVTIFQMC